MSRLSGGSVVDAPLADADLARIGVEQPGQQIERGGLARPGRAEQRDELARLDVEVERIEGDHLAVALGHAAEGNAGHAPSALHAAAGHAGQEIALEDDEDGDDRHDRDHRRRESAAPIRGRRSRDRSRSRPGRSASSCDDGHHHRHDEVVPGEDQDEQARPRPGRASTAAARPCAASAAREQPSITRRVLELDRQRHEIAVEHPDRRSAAGRRCRAAPGRAACRAGRRRPVSVKVGTSSEASGMLMTATIVIIIALRAAEIEPRQRIAAERAEHERQQRPSTAETIALFMM